MQTKFYSALVCDLVQYSTHKNKLFFEQSPLIHVAHTIVILKNLLKNFFIRYFLFVCVTEFDFVFIWKAIITQSKQLDMGRI